MTYVDTTQRREYTATSSQTVFAYTFRILANTDIKVYDDGVLKTLTTHYTVSGVGDAGGGNVTFGTGVTEGNLVVITRSTPDTQNTDYTASGPFAANDHETALDKLAMKSQDLDEKIGRSFKFATTSTLNDIDIPEGTSAANRATKAIVWNTAGDNITLGTSIGENQGNWATSTAYLERDLVKDTSNNNIYYCNTAHTSSGSQPISSNADSAKWDLIVDAASAASSATAAASSATSAASSASTATTQASNASTSASSASSSASSASTAQTNAETAETNAETAESNAEASAGALAWKYTFDSSTTMADPGAGEIRFDNATVASVTNLAMDATSADTGNPDVSDLIASIDDGSNDTHEGYVTIRKSGTPATFACYSVTGAVTDSTGWLQVPVTHVASNGTISNTDTLYISFVRTGAKGATGATGPAGAGSDTPADNVFRITDQTDTTKRIAFEASGVSTSTTRTVTMPDKDLTLIDEGTELKSTGEAGGTKFLREDGDNSCSWQTITGGGPSLGTDSVIRTNAKTISENITFAGDENGSTVGPVSVANTYTVVVSNGSTWTII
jgi:hypothetical protein